jgi:hypothetical protein
LGDRLNTGIFIVVATMLVPGLLYLGKISVLNDRKHWLRLSLLAAVSVVVAAGLLLAGLIGLAFAVASSIPLLHLLLLRICRRMFVGLKGREPKDVSLVWSTDLVADRIFAFVYVLLAFGGAFALVGSLIWRTQAVA